MPYFRNAINDGAAPRASIDSDYFGYRNLDTQEIDGRPADARPSITSFATTCRSATSPAGSGSSSDSRDEPRRRAPSASPATGRQPIARQRRPRPAGLACPGTVPRRASIRRSRPARPDPRPVELRAEFHNQTDCTAQSSARTARCANIRWSSAGSQRLRRIMRSTPRQLSRNPNGSAFAPLPIDASANPDTVYTGPINSTITAAVAARETSNKAIYAFDTLELGRSSSSTAASAARATEGTLPQPIPLPPHPPGTAPLTPAPSPRPQTQRRDAVLLPRRARCSSRAEAVSLYAAYANSTTPSSATVRLGCTSGSGATFVNFCDVAPETARSYEIGAKADVRRRLLLTAAAVPQRAHQFPRAVERSDAAPARRCSTAARGSTASRSARSATSRPSWTIFANYTYLDGEVLQSVSDFCLADAGRRRLPQQRGDPRSAGRRPRCSRRRRIRAACSPPTASRSGSRSATA